VFKPHYRGTFFKTYGSVGEWFKPPVLKTGDPKGSVSSNLTASAILFNIDLQHNSEVEYRPDRRKSLVQSQLPADQRRHMPRRKLCDSRRVRHFRAVAKPGIALALDARDRKFESSLPDHFLSEDYK
jgi:hypothetical protein